MKIFEPIAASIVFILFIYSCTQLSDSYGSLLIVAVLLIACLCCSKLIQTSPSAIALAKFLICGVIACPIPLAFIACATQWQAKMEQQQQSNTPKAKQTGSAVDSLLKELEPPKSTASNPFEEYAKQDSQLNITSNGGSFDRLLQEVESQSQKPSLDNAVKQKH